MLSIVIFSQAVTPFSLNPNNYFDIQIDRFEQYYANKSAVDWSGIKVRKVNKTRMLIGEIINYNPFGNDYLAEV